MIWNYSPRRIERHSKNTKTPPSRDIDSRPRPRATDTRGQGGEIETPEFLTSSSLRSLKIELECVRLCRSAPPNALSTTKSCTASFDDCREQNRAEPREPSKTTPRNALPDALTVSPDIESRSASKGEAREQDPAEPRRAVGDDPTIRRSLAGPVGGDPTIRRSLAGASERIYRSALPTAPPMSPRRRAAVRDKGGWEAESGRAPGGHRRGLVPSELRRRGTWWNRRTRPRCGPPRVTGEAGSRGTRTQCPRRADTRQLQRRRAPALRRTDPKHPLSPNRRTRCTRATEWCRDRPR